MNTIAKLSFVCSVLAVSACTSSSGVSDETGGTTVVVTNAATLGAPTGTLDFDVTNGFTGLVEMTMTEFDAFRSAALAQNIPTVVYSGQMIFEDSSLNQDTSLAEAIYTPTTNMLNLDVDGNSLVPDFTSSGIVQDFGDGIPSMIDDTVVGSDGNLTYIGVVLAEFHGSNGGGIAVYTLGDVTVTGGGSYEALGVGALNR